MSAEPDLLDDHGQEEKQRHAAQHQAGLQVIRFLRFGHITNFTMLQKTDRLTSGPQRHYFTVGGVSNVWNGAGLGTVHSRPSAPSHGLSAAFARSPPPRYVGNATANRKYTCARPKPNAPMVATWLKSVNCAG